MHSESLRELGLEAVKGSTELVEDGETISRTAELDGTAAISVAIEVSGGDCNPSAGSVNYAYDIAEVGFAVKQIGWPGDICPTTSVSVEFDSDDEKLQPLKPASVAWAVLIRDLGFSASPPFPVDLAAK